jgi:hypothetical protein
MSVVRPDGPPEDGQGTVHPEGEGLAGEGISLPWLRHALSHGPDEGASGELRPDEGDGEGTDAATPKGDPVLLLLREDYRRLRRGGRKRMTWKEYRRTHGILDGEDWRDIRETEHRLLDMERINDCD